MGCRVSTRSLENAGSEDSSVGQPRWRLPHGSTNKWPVLSACPVPTNEDRERGRDVLTHRWLIGQGSSPMKSPYFIVLIKVGIIILFTNV